MNEELERMRSMGFLEFLSEYGRKGLILPLLIYVFILKWKIGCLLVIFVTVGFLVGSHWQDNTRSQGGGDTVEEVQADDNGGGQQEADAKRRAEEEAREAKKKAEEAKAAEGAKRKATVKALGLDVAGTSAGEMKVITLPGGVQMEMVWCPAGKFMMGSNNGEEDERPVHEVTLTKGFWMAKTEVTQVQWKSVMGNNPSYTEGANLPVEEVSWYDCQEFCKKTGLQLPTEAQWEYACRAGSSRPHAGTGWFSGNSEGKTHPVGQKQPNAWGLYDMHGNVSEWCADWYGDYPGGAVTEPTGAGSGVNRVLRGGSCRDNASNCRSADRGRSDPGRGFGNAGFRPVARQD